MGGVRLGEPQLICFHMSQMKAEVRLDMQRRDTHTALKSEVLKKLRMIKVIVFT